MNEEMNMHDWPLRFEVFDSSSKRQSRRQFATIQRTAGATHLPTVKPIHLPFEHVHIHCVWRNHNHNIYNNHKYYSGTQKLQRFRQSPNLQLFVSQCMYLY